MLLNVFTVLACLKLSSRRFHKLIPEHTKYFLYEAVLHCGITNLPVDRPVALTPHAEGIVLKFDQDNQVNRHFLFGTF